MNELKVATVTVPEETAKGFEVNTSPSPRKYDNDKPRMELLSTPAIEAIAQVLTYGARKYTTKDDSGDHNWRKGFNWSRLLGAAIRHMFAWMRGEDKDPESGLSHLAHAGCCIMFLLEHEITGLGKDDRWISGRKP